MRISTLSLCWLIAFYSGSIYADKVAEAQPGETNQQAPSVPSGLNNKTLAEIYAMPIAEVEAKLLNKIGPECAKVNSIVSSGQKDPANLSRAELCAVQYYTLDGNRVNKKLWATTPEDSSALDGDDWAYARVLDAALKKMKLEPPRTVYRGTSTKEVRFGKPGEVVRLKGYSSSSSSQDAAEGFIKDRLMIIKNAKTARNIKLYSNAGGEDEFLLPRSSRVKLEKKEMKSLQIFSEVTGRMEKRMVEVVTVSVVD